MKKVAIIAPNSLPVPPIRGGGIQTVLSEIAPLYREYKPYIFSNCEYGIDKLPLRETDGNIEHHRICLSGWEEFKVQLMHLTTRNYFPYVREISKQIMEIRPDIVHVMNRPWFLPILRKYLGPNIKIINHHHNHYFAEMSARKVSYYLSLMDAFAGISNFTVMEEMIKRFPMQADRCFTIYNGINTDKFKPKWMNKEKADQTRKRFKIDKGDLVLMFAGRLRKEKGIHTLLKAASTIIKKNKKVKLLIVGSHFYKADDKKTAYIQNLKKLAEPIRQSVIFTGFIPPAQMPEIYAASDILIVPSHADAFGLTYAEAASVGLPAIGSKLGGIPEVIDDAETGFLMKDPENADELVSLINFLMNNPDKMRAFGEAGRKKVENMFSAQSSAANTEEMYNKVLTFPDRS
jgi:spore coat protein SA